MRIGYYGVKWAFLFCSENERNEKLKSEKVPSLLFILNDSFESESHGSREMGLRLASRRAALHARFPFPAASGEGNYALFSPKRTVFMRFLCGSAA